MAKIESIIPFLLFWESGVASPGATPEQLFLKARAKGIALDPSDAGGATLAGITLGTLREYRRLKNRTPPSQTDLARLSYAEWLDILHSMFWSRWQADRIASQPIAHMLVDWVWTSGSYGITIPQRLLGAVPDGIVGEQTLAALSSQAPGTLFAALKKERIAYIDRICRLRPANARFRNGWLKRIDNIPPPTA